MKIGYVFVAIAFLVLSTSFKSKLTVDEILEKHIEALGGAENLDKIESISYSLESNWATTNIEKVNGKSCLKSTIFKKGEALNSLIYEDRIVYCREDGLDSNETRNLGWNLELKYVFELYKAKERGWEFDLIVNSDDRKYYVLKAYQSVTNQNLIYYLNKRTFLIEIIEVPGSRPQALHYYKKYKEIEGVNFPTKTRFGRIPFTWNKRVNFEVNKLDKKLKKTFYQNCRK